MISYDIPTEQLQVRTPKPRWTKCSDPFFSDTPDTEEHFYGPIEVAWYRLRFYNGGALLSHGDAH